MVIVLVSGYTKLFIQHILEMPIDNYVIKQVGNKIFFYFDTDLKDYEIMSTMKKTIKEKCGPQYAYQIYTIYNGMIDLTPYLPIHIKDTNKYYLNPSKDLTDKELTAFLHTIKG